MITYNNRYKLHQILFSLTVCLSTLSSSSLPVVKIIGYVSLLLLAVEVFVLSAYSICYRRFRDKKLSKLFLLLYFVTVFFQSYFGEIIDTNLIVQVFISILVINYLIIINREDLERIISIISKIIPIFIVFSIVYIITSSTSYTKVEGFFGNSNTFGLWLLGCFGYYYLCDKSKIRNVMLFLVVALIFMSGSRTVLFSVFFSVVSFYFLYRFKFPPRLFMTAVFSILIGLTYIYVYLYESPYGTALNLWSQSVFDKNFFSGRQLIWSDAIQSLNDGYWMFGYGSGATGNTLLGIELSIHNSYIQILIQNGILGLFLLLLGIVFYYNKTMDRKMYKSLSVVSAIFICATFEVIIMQNKTSIFLFLMPIFILSNKEC